MAEALTDFATLQTSALTDASAAPNLKAYGGNLYFLEVKIADHNPSAADTLKIARLPKGARLVPALCSVDYEDPGDALTGDIGYIYDDGTGDQDGFGVSLALGNAAGRKAFSEAGTKGAAFLTPVKFTDDAWVYATWDTVTNGAAHDQTWHLAYTLA